MAETFHIITEASEALVTEDGDFLIWALGGAGGREYQKYKRKLPRYIVREIERAEEKVDIALDAAKPQAARPAAVAKAERAVAKLETFAATLADPEPVFSALDAMRAQIDAYRSGLVYARHRRLLLEDDEWLMMN